MWTKNTVDEALKSYVEDKARALHLALEIKDIERKIAIIELRLPSDESGLKAQVITGMPHGTSVGNPTEQAAIKLASGWEPQELKDLRAQLLTLKSEYDLLTGRSCHVDAWLEATSEREHFVLLHQYIQGEYWSDVVADFSRRFGSDVTKDILKGLRKKAFKRVYAAAGIKN